MRRLQPQEGLGHLGVAPRRRVYRGTHPLEPAAPLLRARGIRADVCHRSHSATDEDAHDLTPRIAGGSCDERDLHGGRKESWWVGDYSMARVTALDAASVRGTRQPGRDRVLYPLDQPAVIAQQHGDDVAGRDERRLRGPRRWRRRPRDRRRVDLRDGRRALLRRAKDVDAQLRRTERICNALDVEYAAGRGALLYRDEAGVGQPLLHAARLPEAFGDATRAGRRSPGRARSGVTSWRRGGGGRARRARRRVGWRRPFAAARGERAAQSPGQRDAACHSNAEPNPAVASS